MIEIESKETNFSAYMLFSTGEKYLRDRISFNVDNSQNFAPTDGADLIINPNYVVIQKPTQILLLIQFQARMFPRPLKILVLLVMVGLKTIMGSNVCVFLVEET